MVADDEAVTLSTSVATTLTVKLPVELYVVVKLFSVPDDGLPPVAVQLKVYGRVPPVVTLLKVAGDPTVIPDGPVTFTVAG